MGVVDLRQRMLVLSFKLKAPWTKHFGDWNTDRTITLPMEGIESCFLRPTSLSPQDFTVPLAITFKYHVMGRPRNAPSWYDGDQ